MEPIRNLGYVNKQPPLAYMGHYKWIRYQKYFSTRLLFVANGLVEKDLDL